MRTLTKRNPRSKINYLNIIYNFFLFHSLRLQYIEYSSFSKRLSGVLWIVYGASSVGKSTFVNSIPASVKCIRVSADNILKAVILQTPPTKLDFFSLVSRMYGIICFILSKGCDLIFDMYSPESWFQFIAACNLRVDTYYYFLYCSLGVQVSRVVQRNQLAYSLNDSWNLRRGYDSLRQSISMFVACHPNGYRKVEVDLSRKTLTSNLSRLTEHNYLLFSENREDLLEEYVEVCDLIFNRKESAAYEPRYPSDFIIDTEKDVDKIISENQLINSKIQL